MKIFCWPEALILPHGSQFSPRELLYPLAINRPLKGGAINMSANEEQFCAIHKLGNYFQLISSTSLTTPIQ
jgi:hypothetical protein